MSIFRKPRGTLPALRPANTIVVSLERDERRDIAPPLACPLPDQARDRVDICAAMFEACKDFQSQYLDRCGATCMFDVSGGTMARPQFEILRAIVAVLFADIAETSARKRPAGAVSVTVQRSGDFWALAVAENLSGDAGAVRASRRLAMVRALTDRADCIVRAVPNARGTTIAVAFPASGRPKQTQIVLH